jgi:hypothetical protein
MQRRIYQQFELDWLFDRQISRLDGPFYRREEETIIAKMKHRSGTWLIASMARRNQSGELDGNARRCSKNLHGTA